MGYSDVSEVGAGGAGLIPESTAQYFVLCSNFGIQVEGFYQRVVPRLGHKKAIWAVAHRICRVSWKVLHQGVRYEELGQGLDVEAVRKRASRLATQLRKLGYSVTPPLTEVAF